MTQSAQKKIRIILEYYFSDSLTALPGIVYKALKNTINTIRKNLIDILNNKDVCTYLVGIGLLLTQICMLQEVFMPWI